MLGSIQSVTNDPAYLRHWLGVDTGALHFDLDRQIRETIQASRLPQILNLGEDTLVRMLTYLAREKFDEYAKTHLISLSPEIGKVAKAIPDLAAKAQKKALADNQAERARLKELTKLSWMLVDFSEPSLVLPDCVAIARAGGTWSSALLPHSSDVEEVVFPLTPLRVLIGLTNGVEPTDVQELNQAAIGCSQDFFIAEKRCDELDKARVRIGCIIESNTDAMLRRALDDVLDDDKHGRPETRLRSSIETHAPEPFADGTNFKFLGVDSEETARRIARAAQDVINGFGAVYPLRRLHGVTYAQNISEGLAAFLEETEQDRPVHPPSDNDLYHGVSRTEFVQIDRKFYIHPVIQVDLGHALLAEDQEIRQLGISVLCSSLADAALEELFDARQSAIENFHDRDDFNGALARHGGLYFSTYWSQRLIGGFDHREWRYFADPLTGLIDGALAITPSALQAYEVDNDLDRVFGNACEMAQSILEMAARVAGRLDCADPSIDVPPELNLYLENLGLKDWFRLLREDLQVLFDKAPNWDRMSDFDCLNRHFERVLWVLGIVPENHPEGGGLWVKIRSSKSSAEG